MKKRIKRATCLLAAAIIALTGHLSLPACDGRFSTVARAAASSSAAALPALQRDQAVEQLKDQGLYDSLREAFTAASYEPRWEERPALGDLPPAYHAPNPAQRMSACFTPTGLHLSPHQTKREAGAQSRASAQAEWRATMRLVGYGYGDRLESVGEAEIATRGNRVEYQRTWPPLTEWYVNKAAGLEQGFTLAAPPAERDEGERLRLELELTGGLHPELAEEGRAIALKQEDGELALRYRDLLAIDAEGRALPSEMKVSLRKVILEVEDAGAVYPVTIDPTFSLQQRLAPSLVIGPTSDWPAEGDDFGHSVAISGNTAVVGAPGDNANQGSAYVFVRSGTTWSLQQKVTAADRAVGDKFGHSVAISGNALGNTTIVIGAPFDNINSYTHQGSAYVFERIWPGTSWTQAQKLTAPDGHAGDEFGTSVAIDVDEMVVGASRNGTGSAHIFTSSDGGFGWNWNQKLTGLSCDVEFGYSVAISGQTVVIGAPLTQVTSFGHTYHPDYGSAYVFRHRLSSWTQWQILTPSDAATGYRFGYAVAIDDHRLVVGAPFAGDQDTLRGSAYVFEAVLSHNWSTTWVQRQKLTASDAGNGDLFGSSVAIRDGIVAVGAPFDNPDPQVVGNIVGGTHWSQGSAYVFPFDLISRTWSQQQKLTAASGWGHADDQFGTAVAIDGAFGATTVVVGVPHDYVYAPFWPLLSRAGSAYVVVD